WRITTTGAFAIYDGSSINNDTYGKLYNWYAASSGKLAPKGWHIPSRAEWETLVENLGGTSVAGGKLKSTSSLWMAPNTGATNSSGFSALPSGWKSNSGGYSLIGESAYWWASTPRNTTQGDYLRVDNNLVGSAVNGATNQFGYAIRCLKD
ncbi:MAG: fibrobacter succinogenes major paralogous domain-containing protein, partial [Chitinophagaceae bacterium]|nr:fibrobacter succinogenes major paralogous domain-containing protein [Chitinophagaceae bacterium]